jgi:hypothetical protein
MNTNVRFWLYLAYVFLEREMFQTKVVLKIKTRILLNNFFFRKSRPLWNNVEKRCRAGQATDDNKAYAHWVLDT